MEEPIPSVDDGIPRLGIIRDVHLYRVTISRLLCVHPLGQCRVVYMVQGFRGEDVGTGVVLRDSSLEICVSSISL